MNSIEYGFTKLPSIYKDDKDKSVKQRCVESNQVGLDIVKANEVDFETLYQDNLPPEAQDLNEFIVKMN